MNRFRPAPFVCTPGPIKATGPLPKNTKQSREFKVFALYLVYPLHNRKKSQEEG